MKQVLALAAAFGLSLTPLFGPATAEAHWGRCGGWFGSRSYSSYYSPWYGSGYRSCYSPYSYGYPGYSSYGSGYGYPGYGYSGYPSYGLSNIGYPGFGMNAMSGMGAFGGGFGAASLLSAIGIQGGLGAGQSSYLSVPMGGGMGPASYLQVPVGGGANRPTYMQVPVGGGPGQPIYLQLQLGSASEPAPTPAAPTDYSPVRPTAMPERVAMESYPSDRVDPAPVAVTTTVVCKALPATTPVAERDETSSGSRGIFRFAVLHKQEGRAIADEPVKSSAVAQTVGIPAQPSVALENPTPVLDLGPHLGVPEVRSITADDELPWVAKGFK